MMVAMEVNASLSYGTDFPMKLRRFPKFFLGSSVFGRLRVDADGIGWQPRRPFTGMTGVEIPLSNIVSVSLTAALLDLVIEVHAVEGKLGLVSYSHKRVRHGLRAAGLELHRVPQMPGLEVFTLPGVTVRWDPGDGLVVIPPSEGGVR
jgi:hypothetical protein